MIQVQEYGSAIMYNLGTKEVKTVVFDDVAPELAMAILQFFSSHPPEELLWRTMTALCRLVHDLVFQIHIDNTISFSDFQLPFRLHCNHSQIENSPL